MQIQTGPGIPIKPLHLSSTDNELNSEKLIGVKDNKTYTMNSLPRQQQDGTTTPSLNKPSYQVNNQKTNGKTVYRSPRRPKEALSMHHLYLYSSSSPDNLLTNNDHHLKSSAVPGYSGGRTVYEKVSTPSQAQSSTSSSSKVFPAASLKPSHSSQRNPETTGIQHNPVKNKSPGVSNFQPMPMSNSSGFAPAPPFAMNAPSPSTYLYQNRTNTTASNNSLDGVIAQLVEMGFGVDDVKRAVASSKDHSIQSYLDILVQKGSPTANPDQYQRNQEASYHQQTNTTFESASFTKHPAPSPPAPSPTTSKSWQRQSYSASPLSPKTGSHYHTQQQSYGNITKNSSSDDDEYLSNDAEWQRQHEARRQNYMDSLRNSYTKPFPTTPLSPPQPSQHTKPSVNPSFTTQPSTTSTTPSPSRPMSSSSSPSPSTGVPTSRPIDPDTIKKAIKARTRGNDLFKLGYYVEAEKSYNQALALLPDRHDVTAIISNNRAAARLKNGQYRQCVMDCTFVIDWARQKCIADGKTATIELDDGGGISIRWYDQLGKALHRKAEALEKMARTTEAQLIYQELINRDSGDAKARAGFERCQYATEPKFSHPPPPPPSFSKSTSKYPSPSTNTTTTTTSSSSSSSSTAFPGLDYSIFEPQQPSKAVAAMRARQAAQAKEETERLEKADMVNARIDSWKHGKEKNIRALLSSLDTLLWPGAQWRGAPVNELLEPRKVKLCYMKAIAKVHPDKLPPSTTVEQKLLASGIFSVLNQAWDDFRSNNKI